MDSINGTRAFYKGTSLQCPYKNGNKFLQTVIIQGHKQIDLFLRNGNGVSQTIACLTEQLDTLEKCLCDAQKKNGAWKSYSTPKYMKYLSDASFGEFTGEKFITVWFVNIASLLQLKAIKNDDKNGWLISESR